ncbi:LuxR C-terminal-related transcriptional regulator [Ruegeria sp.]|uniref:helix-turn-helix transcriptional regulator n=1 Tax=Ruegeria sp. TaxID=1879320 RepID=UPI00231B5189|nr:LuxR C-terminal-related transcriptional regulator [Ruegeria sp.]MDA7965464.1 LuxR C-terminal-related transcriptional regulator [Ruegeria sp.]
MTLPRSQDHAAPVSMISLETLHRWNVVMSDAITDIGRDRFPRKLMDALGTILPFKYAFLFVYRPKQRPKHVYSTVRSQRAQQGVQRFIEATYILNPVYNAYLAGVETGVQRITDLAPDAYFSSEIYKNLNAFELENEELGYRTPGWPEGQMELVFTIRLPHGEMVELSLTRSREEGFSDDCLRMGAALLPMLDKLIAWHWSKVRVAAGTIERVPVLDQLIQDFGRGTLTERERQVAQLVLKGHSGEAIALLLGVSLATVKSHRQNLYSKLNISTQQELFNLFLMSIPQFQQ